MSEAPSPSGWRPVRAEGLMETIGPLLARREGPKWRYGLTTGLRHANAVGIVHGGTLAALVDQVMSLVAWETAGRQPVVTVHMDTTFLNPALPGDFLEAEAKVVERKGSLVFLEASVVSGGHPVMRASCVMKVARPDPREERNG